MKIELNNGELVAVLAAIEYAMENPLQQQSALTWLKSAKEKLEAEFEKRI